MHNHDRVAVAFLLITLLAVACGGAASTPTSAPTAATPTPTSTPTAVLPSASPSAAATPTLTAATASPTTTPTATAAPAPTPNAVTEQIDVGGMTREYRVVTPPDVAGRDQLPLLLALHGRTGTIADAETISGYDAMVDPGAVVVYPQGYLGSWNAGTCCEEASRQNIDDVAFIAALIDRMEATYPIDPNRVFVAGGSNGAEMAERAACELSGRIAAIADVVGTLLVDCAPKHPVSVIAIHGTADVNLPIDGGITDDPSCADTPCPAFADTMERWRQIDGCTGEPTVSQDAYTIETAWTACDAGTAVTFIQAIGKGHEWYTSPDDRAVTWEFFMNHPRQ
jgi:polyhydroxybutyrate depolymerase